MKRVVGAAAACFALVAAGCAPPLQQQAIEIEPDTLLRYTDRFDDPNLPGEMQVTVRFEPVSCGTSLTIVQEGVPEAIPAEACYLGWQQSLQLLALLVEQETP